MDGEEKTINEEKPSENETETIQDHFEKCKSAVSSIETWEETANIPVLKGILTDRCLAQSQKDVLQSILEDKAKKLKMFTQFKKILSSIKKELAKDKEYQRSTFNIINFIDADYAITLASRDFYCDGNAIFHGSTVVINQPLMISKIFIDVENFTESVELSYVKIFDYTPKWYTLNVPKEVISNKNKIISLAAYGIMITTQNSQEVCEYLTSLIADNAKFIPVVKGVSRMGYINLHANFEDFVPYAEDYQYIGDLNYKNLYNSVKFVGNIEKWVETYKAIEASIPAKIAVLASFASVLVPQVESFIYIFHIWGMSDIGKTLCLRLAASVWGKPDEYMQNLNATNVGLERTADFLHNMPLILDELQTIAEKREFRDFIYKITQGQGKLRGSVDGVQRTSDWRNAVITTGEQPLTSQNSAGGELNRVFDVYCDKKIFVEPEKVYSSISENYGMAGLYFIKALSTDKFEHLDKFMTWEQQASLEYADLKAKFELWQIYIKNSDYSIDGKKKMCAALLLLTDELVNMIFLGLDEEKSQAKTRGFFAELSRYIEPREDTDVVRRAYDYILAWIAENKSKFAQKMVAPSDNEVASNSIDSAAQENRMPEVWGKFETRDSVFVSGSKLKSVLDDGGFNYELTVKEFNNRDWTVMTDSQDKSTKKMRISGIVVRGIEIKLEI